MAKLTFLGAAGCVTGSKYIVEANGKRLLVDCGLFQGSHELSDRNYQPLNVDPKTVDYAVLTHAHLDHTGWLPRLVGDGYRGPIFANAATIELTGILLKDSAHLQEEDALHAQKGKYSRHAEPRALYTPEDIDPVLKQLREMPRSGGFEIAPGFQVVSYDAGHILGSSSLELTITENGKKTVVVFSGDVGRYDQPILKDPTTPPRADALLCESTYGDRDHPSGSPMDTLADVVNRVAKRGGSIVIPAFAIGRTQTLMYFLRQLEDSQRIPRIPVYIDSPMALDATELYLKHREDHDLEFSREESGGKGDPLNVHEFHLGHRRARPASSGAAAARSEKCRAAGGVSGGGLARTGAARGRKAAAHVRARGSGESGDCGTPSTFGSRGQKRAAALAKRVRRAAEADLAGAWRAAGGAVASSGNPVANEVERLRGPVFRYR